MLNNGFGNELIKIFSNPHTCITRRCNFKDSERVYDTIPLDSIYTQRFHMVKTPPEETCYQGKDLQRRRKKH